jgi:hypothetical protein
VHGPSTELAGAGSPGCRLLAVATGFADEHRALSVAENRPESSNARSPIAQASRAATGASSLRLDAARLLADVVVQVALSHLTRRSQKRQDPRRRAKSKLFDDERVRRGSPNRGTLARCQPRNLDRSE